MGGRVGPLWRIKQAPEKIQGGNTQCEHPEKKSLRDNGNTIPQESGSAAFRRLDTVAATVAQSRARTPGTSSTGQEMTMVCVAEEWIEKVFEVQRVSDRII